MRHQTAELNLSRRQKARKTKSMWVSIPIEDNLDTAGNSLRGTRRTAHRNNKKTKEILDDTVLCVTDDATPL